MKQGLIKKIGITTLAISSLIPKIAKAQEEVKIDLSSTIASHYIAMGYILGGIGHKQDCISINKNGLGTFFWQDYDFEKKETGEIDVAVFYEKNLTKKLSGKVEGIYMHYPKGDDDKVLKVGITYEGIVNASLDFANFFKDAEIENGIVFSSKISKDFPLNEKNNLNIGISADYVNKFYGDTGFTNVTPEIMFYHEGKKLDFGAYVGIQIGFINEPAMLPAAKNQLNAGITLSKSF